MRAKMTRRDRPSPTSPYAAMKYAPLCETRPSPSLRVRSTPSSREAVKNRGMLVLCCEVCQCDDQRQNAYPVASRRTECLAFAASLSLSRDISYPPPASLFHSIFSCPSFCRLIVHMDTTAGGKFWRQYSKECGECLLVLRAGGTRCARPTPISGRLLKAHPPSEQRERGRSSISVGLADR